MRNFLAPSETLAGTDCETPYSELDKHWKQEYLINPFVLNGCIGNEWVNSCLAIWKSKIAKADFVSRV